MSSIEYIYGYSTESVPRMNVPFGIDPEAVKAYLSSLSGATAVHDLHIWPMSTTETALTAHLVKPDPKNDDVLTKKASMELHQQFGIEHTTLQWEREDTSKPCTPSCDVDV